MDRTPVGRVIAQAAPGPGGDGGFDVGFDQVAPETSKRPEGTALNPRFLPADVSVCASYYTRAVYFVKSQLALLITLSYTPRR